jgi:hypothetical protein
MKYIKNNKIKINYSVYPKKEIIPYINIMDIIKNIIKNENKILDNIVISMEKLTINKNYYLK